MSVYFTMSLIIKISENFFVLQEFFLTALEFFKLEKVEIGGSKGRFLSPKVQDIYIEFCELYSLYGGVTYNAFDPNDDSFLKDYVSFKKRTEDFDRKLATVFCQAFDDCHNLESIYKVKCYILYIFFNNSKQYTAA